MTSADESTEGSWIPSLVVLILVVFWWISRSQSTTAVQVRRWYSVKVRSSKTVIYYNPLWIVELESFWNYLGSRVLLFSVEARGQSRVVRFMLDSLQQLTNHYIYLLYFTVHNYASESNWTDLLDFIYKKIRFSLFFAWDEFSQRVQLKKKLGLRDDSKYKMSAGDGANQKYKRQG